MFNVKKDMPVGSMKELVVWLKTNPDKATMGSTGAGSPGNLLGVLMRKDTGTQFQIAPYRGVALVMQDLVAGQIHMAFSNPATAMPHVRSGAIKALGVTSKDRLSIAANVPTMNEAGVPNLYFSLWAGLFGPKDLPPHITAKLTKAAGDAMAEPSLRKKLIDQGFDVAPRERQTPGALAAQQKADIKKWWPIIREAGIKAQ